MSRRKKSIAAIGLGLVMALANPGQLRADDTAAAPDPETETPAFSSPAQAQHAAALAEAAVTADSSVREALREVETAQEALEQALATGLEVDEARQALEDAQESYMEVLSEISGVLTSEIAAMRESGMGWGEIAQELGVHPGLLGLGYTRGNQNHHAGTPPDQAVEIDPDELARATARDLETGWSRGHGVSIHSGVHEAGTGLATGVTGMESASGRMAGAGGLGSGAADHSDVGGGPGNGHGDSSGSSAGSDGAPGASDSGHGPGGGSSSSGGHGGGRH